MDAVITPIKPYTAPHIQKNRIPILDAIRGIALCNMIIYHTLWDLQNLYSVSIPFLNETLLYIYQQCICWTFILLSGFCSYLSRKNFSRGILVTLCGALISIVTAVFTPDSRIIFGILTFLGIAMLLTSLIKKLKIEIYPPTGTAVCAFLFLMLRNIPKGSLGFESLKLAELPKYMYLNTFTSFFGFRSADFASSDYFPIFPWIFLFLTGYFFSAAVQPLLRASSGQSGKSLLRFMGKHSLVIYMVHQPLIYGALQLFFRQ